MSSSAVSYQSEFDHFIQSQITSLIGNARERNPKLGRGEELGIAIDFCKRFLIDGGKREDGHAAEGSSSQIHDHQDNADEAKEPKEGERTSQKMREELVEELAADEQQRRKEVLQKLVELKLELEEYKESLELRATDAGQVDKVKGHEMAVQSATGGNAYCEACLGIIWRLVQRWRRCKVCGFRVHEKCLGLVGRPCVGLKLAGPADWSLLCQICPEQLLRDQDHQCAECSAQIAFDDDPERVPRLCDYTGHYYCRRCHWNDEMVIPARLIRNWDAQKRPVCRASKQLLRAIARRPLIDLPRQNPALFKFVQTLARMNQLRGTILLMKCYFVSCKVARKLRILQHLGGQHQHFVDSDCLYSLEDLVQLANGRLLAEIESIVHIFRRHITEECQICRGNAFFCELCQANERIYPFSENTAICKECMAVYHGPCFERASKRCPRCARRRARRRRAMKEEGEEGSEWKVMEND